MTQAVGRNRWLFAAMIVVALAVRLVLAFYVQTEVSKTPGRLCLIDGGGDAEGYWELAGKLAAGQDYWLFDPPRHLLRMPGFPLLLAVPRLVFGDNTLPARLVLVVVGTFACALTFWMGR